LTIFQAFVLGVLQGLAEFLPISSSAHLSLAPWIFGWPAPGLAFDVSLHVGTLAAVLWFFQEEWTRLVRGGFEIIRARKVQTEAQRRAVFLVIATIPGGIAGILLNKFAETIFRTPALTGAALIIMGVVLWAIDKLAPSARPIETMRWQDALVFGLAQVVALVPGVSRSGSTIAAGRALGFSRESAAVFSFLMSMPITAAAAAVKVPEAIRESGLGAPLLVGIVASAVSGWLAISVLLKYVSRHSFGVFAWYRLALGVFVLWLVAHRV